MTTTIVETRRNPGCLLQLLWFAVIGWWLGQLWMAAAWLLMVTILGIPIAIAMLNRLPKMIALREAEAHLQITTLPDGSIRSGEVQPSQINFFLRSLYFVLVGWWFSALWMEAAYAVCMTVIGLPLGFWMFDRIPLILTLKRT